MLGDSTVPNKQASPFDEVFGRVQSGNARLSEIEAGLRTILTRIEGPTPEAVSTEPDAAEVPQSILGSLNAALDRRDRQVNRINALVDSLAGLTQ